ncbi:myelin basic protein-like [Gadus chalcogrammus]|uniref:myelin basic protein-like n=1 Tax=Gadus chalcogrammus TaxID=1042646 RepID=UPI0024C496EC|nr:myelin basic protein-like [Gadus chalcogrammus]
MGQHLGKKEPQEDIRAPSPQPEANQKEVAAEEPATVETDSQDEVFGLGEADVNQNNGHVSEGPAVTDATGAEGPVDPEAPAEADDPEGAVPRPHLVRLFSRDAPGREDNTFKDRPSESDELQTIHEHSTAGSECGSESPEQDIE